MNDPGVICIHMSIVTILFSDDLELVLSSNIFLGSSVADCCCREDPSAVGMDLEC